MMQASELPKGTLSELLMIERTLWENNAQLAVERHSARFHGLEVAAAVFRREREDWHAAALLPHKSPLIRGFGQFEIDRDVRRPRRG